jgi:hypothetical protein
VGASVRLPLGAPGIHRQPEPLLRALTGVRLDVCGFAGVAVRGPVREPVVDEEADGRFWRGGVECVDPDRPRHRTVAVALESFDDYRRLFGGFEGPGLLPYSVAAFFENGGRRAVVARIVHDYGPGAAANDAGVAVATLAGLHLTATLRARNEGTWANRMRAQLSFAARPTVIDVIGGALRPAPGAGLAAGTLLRITLDSGVQALRFVGAVVDVPDGERPAHVPQIVLDAPLPAPAERFEIVEAALVLDDGDGRVERFEHLGLADGHPRWLARVLCEQSMLAWPGADWASDRLIPVDAALPSLPTAQFGGGVDRWRDLVHEDFFDARWAPENGAPGDGICCFAGSEVATLVVPDLYSPAPLAPYEAMPGVVSFAGPTFAPCLMPPTAPPQTVPVDELEGLHLDPLLDVESIAALQQRVIDFAESTQDVVALLDVPPGLDPARIRRWRMRLASSYAAAYHPWLDVARAEDLRDRLVTVPPSAVAAGIIAATELAHGVPHGPANALGSGLVRAAIAVAPAQHDELHQRGINVWLRERDGIRLTAARTLATDPRVRQLSVRRLMILLKRVLLQQMQWVVFEPNRPALWRELRQILESYLRTLHRHGAFRGATEEEAFFVHCDETLNPQAVLDQGRLVVEIGVAPAEPIEFIVLRIARSGDGMLTITE